MKIKLPSPFELACIAANLPSGDDDKGRLQKAMEIYIAAEDLLSELQGKPREELLGRYGNEHIMRKAAIGEDQRRSLVLDVDAASIDDCEVRSFFLTQGRYKIQTVRTVLENIKKYGGKRAEDMIKEAKFSGKNGKTRYLFHEALLQSVIRNRRKSKSKSAKKKM